MSTTAYAWAPITKVEDQDDGTVMVYGAATDTTLDRDQQRMDQGWLDKAMPQWMAEGGNIREQHDPRRAVGVGVGLHKDEGSGAWMLTSRVVDPVAVLKVKAGVLKGYSIGVKDPHITFGKAEAPNGLIDGGTVCETSLADRPSNPGSYFTLAKADAAGVLVPVEVPELVEDAGTAELKAKAEGILAEVRVLVPNLDKADAAGDIAEAMTAIACIGRLIASEATSLAAGQLSDEHDISCLLDAVRALKYFISCESEETETTGATASEVDDSLSMNGDIFMANAVKTETAAVPPVVTAAPTGLPAPVETPPDLTKVDSPDVAAIVKAAVAEAVKPLEDQLGLVKADLAKVAAMPEPGGPVGMRTAAQTVAARGADAAHLRAQAAEYLVKADDRGREDPLLADGYRARAAELLAKADA